MSDSADGNASVGQELWAYIISWTGWGENARAIADQIQGHVDRLVVIYSNADEQVESGAGEWQQVPNSHYYGRKFDLALRQFSGGNMLHIQADVTCDDWPNLIRRCRLAFATNPGLGIWTPNIEQCGFDLERTLLRPLRDGLYEVVTTDAIVWALSSTLCDALRPLDYTANTFGWGIDATAAARARTKGLSVLLDSAVRVIHPYGSAYDTRAAARSQYDFLFQLSPHERRVVRLLYEYTDLRSLLSLDNSELEQELLPSLQSIKRPFKPLVRRLRWTVERARRRAR